MSAEELVEGWTGPLDFLLLSNGSAIDGTGMTVTMVLRDKGDNIISTSGEVAWLVAASGTVRYSPSVTDLVASKSPYEARFKVVDGSGKIVYFPNADPIRWDVSK